MSEIKFNGDEWEVSEALQAFYVPYSSYVIQTRALPDARDGLKTGARFILYAQYKDKLTYQEKRRKAVATINGAMRFSPHGDASILGTAVRMSQDFSLRYPVIEVQGNNGSYLSGDDYSQARYLEMRGNEIAWSMTELLKKDTIADWRLNYTEEEYYPSVLPTLFPYSLVNGNFGVAVACASSIPPHNIRDVYNAIETLVNNPNATFEEIYCPIDFPTGGTIINEDDVKESLKNGTGRAAIIRATIEYDEKKNELIVREMPYMTFTNNAIKSISNALDEGLLNGIESVYDGTDFEGCKIFIKLTKNANVDKVLKLLYKHTILQNSFSINMNMLEDGKIPRLFTWKESVQAYIDHVKIVLERAFKFDLNKILDRLHLIDGFIIALHNINDLVKDIRSSSDTATAKATIMKNYGLSDIQATAILQMKLSSLTHLEIEKLEKEKEEKETEKTRLNNILNNEEVFKTEMLEKIKEVCLKHADERRTKNISLDFTSEDDDAEPIEKKELLVYFTNLGNIYTQESSTLVTNKRGAKGSRLHLSPNEIITQTMTDTNFSALLAFTNRGLMYSMNTANLPVGQKVSARNLFNLNIGEEITTLTTLTKHKDFDYFVFVTKNGFIKKTKAREYAVRGGRPIKAINLKDNDEVVKVLFVTDEKIGILSNTGNFVLLDSTEISPIGRVTAGVKAIKLSDDESVIDSNCVKSSDQYLITLSLNGYNKKASLDDFPICTRGTKGRQISGTSKGDSILKFLTISKDCDIINISNKTMVKINTNDLRALSRTAIGAKGIELDEDSFVVDMVRS